MKISEIILLAGIAILSAILLYGSFDMPYSTAITFGPGFIPLNISAALLVLVVGRLLFGLRSGRTQPNTEEQTSTARGSSKSPSPRALVECLLLLAVAIYAMSLIGVLIPLSILMALVSWRFLGHGLLKSVGVSVVVLICVYGIFSVWLGVPIN